MVLGLLPAQLLETFRVGQHLPPLLRQGGQRTGERLLLGHADLKHLLSFRAGWATTQGGQAQGPDTSLHRPSRLFDRSRVHVAR